MSNQVMTLPPVLPQESMSKTDRPQARTSPLQYSPTKRGMTSRRSASTSTSNTSSSRPQSPYEEKPFYLSLYQGKTLPPPKTHQKLIPTVNYGHIPHGTMHPPVVCETREIPQAVVYTKRAEHMDAFDKNYELGWNEKYRRKNKCSPYKGDLYSLRASSVKSTHTKLKERDIQSTLERKKEVDEYVRAVEKEAEVEKHYPKGDLIHTRAKYLRIILTD